MLDVRPKPAGTLYSVPGRGATPGIPQPDGNASIRAGAILVEASTSLPNWLRLENDSTGAGWVPVEEHLDGRQIERKLADAGWTFLFMAGSITATAFGLKGQRATDAALKRLIVKVKLQECNCLEIDSVAMHSFLGVPYVKVSAHARHIQQAMVFTGK